MLQGGSGGGDWRDERKGWKWCKCFSFKFLRAMKRIWKRKKYPYTWNHRNSDCLHKTSTRSSNQNSSIEGSKAQDAPRFIEDLLKVVGSWGQKLLSYFSGRPVLGYLCSSARIGNIIQATEMQKKKKKLERTWSLERDVFRHLGVLGDINVWDFHTDFYTHLKF